jgi:hypothetical protein
MNERKYLSAVANLGCILCRHLALGESLAEIHHVRRFGGKRSLAPVIPLCREHHRGDTGVHGLGAKGFEKRYGITQERLREEVESLLPQE